MDSDGLRMRHHQASLRFSSAVFLWFNRHIQQAKRTPFSSPSPSSHYGRSLPKPLTWFAPSVFSFLLTIIIIQSPSLTQPRLLLFFLCTTRDGRSSQSKQCHRTAAIAAAPNYNLHFYFAIFVLFFRYQVLLPTRALPTHENSNNNKFTHGAKAQDKLLNNIFCVRVLFGR